MFRKDRSDEPIYWGLFGAGGMVVAIVLPAIIIATMGLTHSVFDTAMFANVILSPVFSLAFIGIMILCTWHALHRIYHTLHDLTIHVGTLHHIIIYGLALLISLAFIGCYLIILFKNFF
jgi:fumarate reductase subunit D